MSYFVTPAGDYYEGDRASALDVEVPRRPDATFRWVNGAWAQDAAAARAAANAPIDAQIAELEQAAGGYNRGTREFMLGMAAILKQCVPNAPDIGVTPGMQKIKALDDQIKALRAQRVP